MENNGINKILKLAKIWIIIAVAFVTLVAAGTVTFIVLFESLKTGTYERKVYNLNYDGNYTVTAEYIADMMGGNVVEVFSQSDSSISTGSGFVIAYNGDNPVLMTNYHVIDIAPENVYVRTVYETERMAVKATLLGFDEYHDIAVLQLPAIYKVGTFLDLTNATGEGFEKDSFFATATTGEYLAAIGNALGGGLGIVDGICTKGSTVILYNENAPKVPLKYVPVFQTTAAINSGMSGSPIFNKYGQVVGVGTYKASSADDINFGVPMDIALAVYREVMTGKISSTKQVTLFNMTTSVTAYSANISAVGSGSAIEYYQFNALGAVNSSGFGASLHPQLGFSGKLLTGRGDDSKGLLDQGVNTGLEVTESRISGLNGKIITKINGIAITADYGKLFSALYTLKPTTTNAKEPIKLTLSDGSEIKWLNGSYRVVTAD